MSTPREGQKYFDAAKGKNLRREFHATGIDFADAPETAKPGVVAGIGGALGSFLSGSEKRGEIENIMMQLQKSGNTSVMQMIGWNSGMGGAAAVDSDEDKRKKEQEEHHRWMLEQIGKYNDIADQYAALAKQAATQMDKITVQMNNNDEFIEFADNAKNTYIDTGKFDREKAIEALRKHGVAVDKNISDKDLRDLVNKEKEKAISHNAVLSKEYGEWEKRYQTHAEQEKRNRDKAKEYQEKADAFDAERKDGSHVPDAEQMAKERTAAEENLSQARQKLEDNKIESEKALTQSKIISLDTKKADEKSQSQNEGNDFAAFFNKKSSGENKEEPVVKADNIPIAEKNDFSMMRRG